MKTNKHNIPTKLGTRNWEETIPSKLGIKVAKISVNFGREIERQRIKEIIRKMKHKCMSKHTKDLDIHCWNCSWNTALDDLLKQI